MLLTVCCCFPCSAIYFVLTGLPLLSCLMLSVTEGEVGLFPTLANYRLVLRDNQFLLALRNTLWLAGLGISLQLLPRSRPTPVGGDRCGRPMCWEARCLAFPRAPRIAIWHLRLCAI